MPRSLVILVLIVSLAPAGCMQFEVTSNESPDQRSAHGNRTIHRSLYKIEWSEWKNQPCKDTALSQVEFTFTGFQLLASAFTFGLYVPQTVEWWCVPKQAPDESGEEGIDLDDE